MLRTRAVFERCLALFPGGPDGAQKRRRLKESVSSNCFLLPGDDHLLVLLVLGHSRRIGKEDQLSEKAVDLSFPLCPSPGPDLLTSAGHVQ